VFRPEEKIKRVLCQGERFKVVECGKGEKFYLLEEFPELSKEEAVLLKGIIEEFRADYGAKKEGIAGAMEKFLEKNLVKLDERQRQYFLAIIFAQVNGFGPISLLLEDEALEEIALIGTGKNFPLRVFHRLHGWCKCNAYFYDKKSVVNAVNRMLLKTDRRLSLGNPKVNGALPDGSRLNATIPPVSFRQPSFTIRKFNSKKFTPFELIKNCTFSKELMAFLWMALETDCSVLVAGNTGSGKTTTLNALFSFVPESERIVLIEETPEMQVPHSHVVRLNTCPERGIGMADLIVDSLRMRPDRIVVGEVRSREEVNAFIDTLLAGQGKGSYASFHAASAEEALKRLELLGVKRMDLCSIDLLLVQKRWDKIQAGGRMEMRRVVEVAEVLEKNAEPKLNLLFEFNHAKGRLEKKGESARVKEKIKKAFSLTEKGFEKELKKRKALLEKKILVIAYD
jgi:Flp pilus assembly CpaF family ATPase